MDFAYTDNENTSSNFIQQTSKNTLISTSAEPKSNTYQDYTYGLNYGPNSIYQVPWPFPVFSETRAPNHDRAFDSGGIDINYDTAEPENIFIGGVVPESGGHPIFDSSKIKYKFRRLYTKSR